MSPATTGKCFIDSPRRMIGRSVYKRRGDPRISHGSADAIQRLGRYRRAADERRRCGLSSFKAGDQRCAIHKSFARRRVPELGTEHPLRRSETTVCSSIPAAAATLSVGQRAKASRPRSVDGSMQDARVGQSDKEGGASPCPPWLGWQSHLLSRITSSSRAMSAMGTAPGAQRVNSVAADRNRPGADPNSSTSCA